MISYCMCVCGVTVEIFNVSWWVFLSLFWHVTYYCMPFGLKPTFLMCYINKK